MNFNELKLAFHQQLNSIYDASEIEVILDYYLEEKTERRSHFYQENDKINLDLELLENDLKDLANYKPIQQVLGFAYFFDLKFKVNEFTLIPRPETEELVDWILQDLDKKSTIKIIDIGTGSGCIPITLKKHLPNAEISAIDFSLEALKLANENKLLNHVDVNFIQQDVFDNLNFDEKFDVIVSNPPYIRELEKTEMHENVLSHEPHTALFVSNQNPLIFYQRICELSKQILNDNGVIYLEINQYLGEETKKLFQTDFEEVELRKDISSNNRMLRVSKRK